MRFEKVLAGLFAVANLIKNIAGRKAVILLSDGIPVLSGKTLNNKMTEAEAPGTVSGARSPQLDIRRDPAQVRVFEPFNILQTKKIMSDEEVIRELIRFANANNAAIYGLEPEALIKNLLDTTAEYGPMETVKQSLELGQRDRLFPVQSLRWLAEETGGASLTGVSKYDQFSSVMRTDLNSYHPLSFYPGRKEPDEAYPKIEIKVLRSGCEVRARKGFTDYSASSEKKLRLSGFGCLEKSPRFPLDNLPGLANMTFLGCPLTNGHS